MSGFDLNDAYGVETPDDNRELYRRWASSYDQDFAQTHGYIYHHNVAATWAERSTDPTASVLDVGCGTGLVGLALRQVGATTIDGVDLSPEMIEVARSKVANDTAVYRALHQADITKSVELEPLEIEGGYAGLVSAGTFTHGHVGPEPIPRLIELLAPGGLAVIGTNAEFYDKAGFAATIDQLAEDGSITDLEFVTVRVYDADAYTAADVEHIDSTANLIVCRRST